ncbi:uncharacterized protein LOC122290110 isoform X1 [Carya illinoinensis]|uniref:uncharacterized protein LOC122290110 isoform X1 n=1 Tax=Carya illinoinensis TaxID=32201 RepID=UPI001C71E836|nr:uncharacterized protein LOC122290110 isoform X1 [Carya illinoinensis]XP_042953587.1 uncharacterized protein LOC122290110 isoform X1 [Carya illinoinensis]XP_042953588.1 uncharacterized protein LOC122290110 isoform X1 [Carya illinoinensis]XP_042953589.1 uncharacterized protein LOC122290110 isoform X1 [Carya illinoinensis]XP_042953590.1 uncharacterized protein LOC122290110 isoform X1 [Carya illinoinensis]XP_042953594.1 uncharacterized protein LOC122290110 isoform X1 [Carya illinoinensis]
MEVSSVQHHQGDEEEFVLLDLNSVSGQLDIPSNAPYVLSGLDTLNPVLIIDDKLKLIGEYEETIGTCLVFTEEGEWFWFLVTFHTRFVSQEVKRDSEFPPTSIISKHICLYYLGRALEPPHMTEEVTLTYLIQEQSSIKSFLQPHCCLFWLKDVC